MSQRLKAVSLCDLGEGKISNSSCYVAKSSCWNCLSNLMASMLLALGFVSSFNRGKLCGMGIMSLEGWPSAWLCYTWPQLKTGFHGGCCHWGSMRTTRTSITTAGARVRSQELRRRREEEKAEEKDSCEEFSCYQRQPLCKHCQRAGSR